MIDENNAYKGLQLGVVYKKDTQAIQNGVIGARMGCEQGLMGVNKRVLTETGMARDMDDG